jgi:hypothetical protein
VSLTLSRQVLGSCIKAGNIFPNSSFIIILTLCITRMVEKASLNKLRSKQERIVKLAKKHFKDGSPGGVSLTFALRFSSRSVPSVCIGSGCRRGKRSVYLLSVTCFMLEGEDHGKVAHGCRHRAVCCTGRALSFSCLACRYCSS